MNDLFLHDSPDASPIVSSDRILYTPTPFAMFALEQAWKDESPQARFDLRQQKLRPLLEQYWDFWTVSKRRRGPR